MILDAWFEREEIEQDVNRGEHERQKTKNNRTFPYSHCAYGLSLYQPACELCSSEGAVQINTQNFPDEIKTHKFYWEKPIRIREKPYHPMENDSSLPRSIRGKHFDSWTQLAEVLGYGE